MGKRAWRGIWPLICIIVLGCVAVGTLTVGSCAVLFGLSGDLTSTLIGLGLCGIAVLCCWAMLELAKRRGQNLSVLFGGGGVLLFGILGIGFVLRAILQSSADIFYGGLFLLIIAAFIGWAVNDIRNRP